MSQPALPPPALLMNLITGKMITQAIVSAVELGMIDSIKDGTKSSDEVAKATGVTADGSYRLLRALTLVGVVSEAEGKRFTLTPVGTLLRSDVPGSLAGMTRFMGASFHTELWFELSHCLKTGEHAVKARHGHDNPFEFFHSKPEILALFQNAMSSFSATVGDALVAGYDFSGFGRLADIGGGHGAILHTILKANPALKGVLFDLPEVVEGARTQLQSVSDRCEIAGGDFFTGVPGGCDAYLFKHIIHDWPDDRCVVMLKNTATAMANGGKVLIVEHVIPPPGVPSFGKLLDLEMLVVAGGGRERTQSEFEQLLKAAGLRLARVVPLPAPVNVIEAVRA